MSLPAPPTAQNFLKLYGSMLSTQIISLIDFYPGKPAFVFLNMSPHILSNSIIEPVTAEFSAICKQNDKYITSSLPFRNESIYSWNL